jgi:glycosyltransferase involved in cell wall biosynthesis
VTPRVSVLIGTYNNAPTLPRAIDSVLGQTIEDLELIVVDDGSSDDTPAIAQGWTDPRLRYLPLPHLGIARSLNEGLQAAHAPFVAIQDADDYSQPTRLERQLELIEGDPDVAVVGSRMREEDPRGRPLEPRTSFAPGDIGSVLMHFNPIPNSCALVRRELVLELGGYDSRYRYAMDYDLWLRLSERGRVVTLDEGLATRVMTGGNVATRNERAQIAETIDLRLRALWRRRSLRGASGIVVGMIAYVAPLPLKRARRRRLGQAP